MGKIKALLGLIVMAVVIYALWNLVPMELAKLQFQDELANTAKFATTYQTEDQIRDQVMKKAQDIGVPVQPDNVHITRDSGHVTITADYEVVITPPVGKPWVFDFHLSSVKT
jgi:hypothetical protein